MSQKTVAIHTLGCKVNQTESASIAEMFKQHGYRVADMDQRADVYIINTCTVTHLSDRKSRQMIRRATKSNPDGLIVVTGCYAQTSPGEVLEIPGVDLVVGTVDKNRIVQLVQQAVDNESIPLNTVEDIPEYYAFQEMPTVTQGGKTRAFIKVQEGCNNFCAYCIIPYARGPLRSRSLPNIVDEVWQLVDKGFKEVVLTGIHTGAYGLDFKDGTELSTLVKELVKIPGLTRLRLSSVEPNDITPELIEVAGNNKVFCKHLHIPLQSGDDQVLKSMGRRYTTKHFADLIEDIRVKMPGVAITTDIIVGFPGETEQMFDNSYNFCRQMAFAGMHVFKYSPRKGTPAANFPNHVPSQVKEGRSKRLIQLGERLAGDFAAKMLGKTVEVLLEHPVKNNPNNWEGLTDTYLRVETEASAGDMRGILANVKVFEVNTNRLYGKINI